MIPELVRKGDVYTVRLGAEELPVVVVSRDTINANSPVVVVVPVTERSSKARIYPSHVVLRPGDGGLTAASIVLTEQVRAMGRTRLSQYVGHLAPQSVREIEVALKVTLDLT